MEFWVEKSGQEVQVQQVVRRTTSAYPQPPQISRRKLSDIRLLSSENRNIDIRAPTPQGLKQTIISTLEKLRLYGQNVIALFWAPTQTGINSILLTTTYQPSVIYGNNEELVEYHEAFLQHKYYINREDQLAFGLPGRVFLKCTPEQTLDVHRYPKDQHPPGGYAFLTRTRGSFCVPVIVDGQCVGVLEFVTDNLKDSYDNDIAVVRTALESAGLQTSIQVEYPKTTKKNGRKRVRKTRALHFTKYRCLVPQFGHCTRVAAGNLKFKRSTFKNLCKDVGIYEWPWIKNMTTRASSDHGTQINRISSSKTSSSARGTKINQVSSSETSSSTHGTQINHLSSSETSFFGTSDASDDISNLSVFIENVNPDFLDHETTIGSASSAPDSSEDISDTSDVIQNITSAPETQNYHIALNEDWIERERERPVFMQQFIDDLIDPSNEAPELMEDIDLVDVFFNSNEWDNNQEQRFGRIPFP